MIVLPDMLVQIILGIFSWNKYQTDAGPAGA